LKIINRDGSCLMSCLKTSTEVWVGQRFCTVVVGDLGVVAPNLMVT